VTVTLVSDDADDALRPAIAALNAVSARGGAPSAVRVLRDAPRTADSAAARDGAAIVHWPRIGTAGATAQGMWAGGSTLVAPLARLPLPAGGRTIARWSDGERAAAEWALGPGCVREIGAGVPASGDVALQPAFVAVARELFAPCESVGAAVPDSVARTFSRPGPAATAAVLRAANATSPLAPWLVGAAILLLAGEMYVRRDGRGAIR
jgi:predicted TIM-barrel enzyme